MSHPYQVVQAYGRALIHARGQGGGGVPAQQGSRRRPEAGLLAIACYCSFLFCITSCTKSLPQNEEIGKELYDIQCSQCHDENQPGLKTAPPKLHGIFSQINLPDGATPATDQAVRQVIIDGERTMRAFNGRLSEDQVADLIAYLHKK
jgi:cytochrome c553